MDDRTWYLVLATLAGSIAVVFLDAVTTNFEVDSAFFAVPGGILSFLAVRATRAEADRARKDPEL